MASIEKRLRNGKVRYYVRYRDDKDQQRTKVYDRKVDAEKFKTTTAADVLRGTYLSPDAGLVKFEDYARTWLAERTGIEETTREAMEFRLALHVYPTLGDKMLSDIKPSTMRSWLKGIDHLAPAYRHVMFANVSTILTSAVDDEMIMKNPCKATSVKAPSAQHRKVVPWTAPQVFGVHDELPEQYRIIATLGAGLGMRQGEIFALSPDDVDFLRGTVEVRRQVKLYKNNRQAFGLPKGNRTRTIPLPSSVRDELAAHLERHPAQNVVLPWTTLDGEPTTVSLICTTRQRTALSRNYFNTHIWHKALVKAGIKPGRENGMHALRHFYASTLLDAGENIRALSEYLGHADPGFTLRTYTHMMPTSSDRTRNAVDSAFSRVPVVYPAATETA